MRNRRHPHFGSLLSVLVIAAIGAVLLVGTSPARAKIALSGTQSHLSATMTQPTTPAAKAAAAKAAKLKAAQLKAAQLKAAKLDDVSAAVPVRVHVFAATPLRLDHELIGLTEALVEVELDLVGVDTAIRSLTGLIRGLEEGERAVAAPRSLGAHVQLSALLVDDSDRLGRGLYAHAPNGTTIELRYQPRHL